MTSSLALDGGSLKPPIVTMSAFIAGLSTALLISLAVSLLVSQNDGGTTGAGRAAKSAREAVWKALVNICWQGPSTKASGTECEVKAECVDVVRTGKEMVLIDDRRCSNSEKRARVFVTEKSFEFRKRLWHEAPKGCNLENDYTAYEHYDAVQKELKKMGVQDLDWKTNWLDFKIESTLLQDYQDWARRRRWTTSYINVKNRDAIAQRVS